MLAGELDTEVVGGDVVGVEVVAFDNLTLLIIFLANLIPTIPAFHKLTCLIMPLTHFVGARSQLLA